MLHLCRSPGLFVRIHFINLIAALIKSLLFTGLRASSVATLLQKIGVCSVIALAVGLIVPAAVAQSRPPPPRAVEGGASLRRLRVTVNKSQTVRIIDAFSDVLVGSSDIADVIPLTDQTLYILGKKVGRRAEALAASASAAAATNWCWKGARRTGQR
jgi:Flp pilus assembly secretin CpaC